MMRGPASSFISVTIIEHPLIADRLSRLRSKDCSRGEFRLLVKNVAHLMVPQLTGDLTTDRLEVETPLERVEGEKLSRPIILVPVLRAGLSLAEGFLDLIPEAIVAHLGLRRNEETLHPEVYYSNPPVDFSQADTILLDPMLATGGSAIEAARILKEQNAASLRFACLIAAPEGVHSFTSAHPDVPLFTAAIDRCLDPQGYIRPGLGDAGDRSFGTT